jgi:hypothetical protein
MTSGLILSAETKKVQFAPVAREFPLSALLCQDAYFNKRPIYVDP